VVGVPEPTTRDEHIARAEELLARADHLLDHPDALNQYGETRPYGTRKSEEETAARLAHVATAHLKAAEVLGQQPAEEAISKAPAWELDGNNSLMHSSGRWIMEYICACETDEVRPERGWYLYGRKPSRGPAFAGLSLSQAKALVDNGIAAQQGSVRAPEIIDDLLTAGKLNWFRTDHGWGTGLGSVEHWTPGVRPAGWYLLRTRKGAPLWGELIKGATSEHDALVRASVMLTEGLAGYADEATA
jgi:hypothetical protein